MEEIETSEMLKEQENAMEEVQEDDLDLEKELVMKQRAAMEKDKGNEYFKVIIL